MIATVTLQELVGKYADSKVELKDGSAKQIGHAVSGFSRHLNHAASIVDLTKEAMTGWMRAMIKARMAVETITRRRGHILTLWRFAASMGLCEQPPRDIPRVERHHRIPQAWTAEEIGLILEYCGKAKERYHPWTQQLTWGPKHWTAIVLTIYDTSSRIGALLKTPRAAFDPAAQTLRIASDDTKEHVETLHKLGDDTVAALLEIDALRPEGNTMLLPYLWSGNHTYLQRIFKADVLRPAGLPCGRRDLFHKIRRTSYTLVAKQLGVPAAGRHAGHKTDMSRHYLDPRLLDEVNPIDILPRPGMLLVAEQGTGQAERRMDLMEVLARIPKEKMQVVEQLMNALAQK